MNTRHAIAAIACTLTAAWLAGGSPVRAQHSHGASGHAGHAAPASGAMAHAPDNRIPVEMPAPMRAHTLSNMRDHLLALAQIQSALASGAFDQAAEIAENRLGMSSLRDHGAHESARYMPAGMQELGTLMHRHASRFAIEAKNASVTGDVKASLDRLSQVTQACVACHAGYRLK